MLRPSGVMEGVRAYAPPPPTPPGALKVDFNEGPIAAERVRTALASVSCDELRRYPDARALTAALADRWGVGEDRVLVTAGGDDALFRICRAMLDPSRSAVMTDPTFEMIPKYAQLTGASLRRVPWLGGAFPVQDVLNATDDTTGAVFIVSPNNPTGLVVSAAEVREIAVARPGTLVVLDAAYGEFDPNDPTQACLDMDNVVVVRTFSKAYGLAALRVGYAIGTAQVIQWLRGAGNPFPCAQPSLAGAIDALGDHASLDARVAQITREREALLHLLREHGIASPQSLGNFVLAPLGEAADGIDASLRAQGVLVRRFIAPSPVAGALRITCPGNGAEFDRLMAALRTSLATVKNSTQSATFASEYRP